ncbi:MAG: ModD protein [Slackia sp.]|nr:ModD protein [Slackia sp.]
MITMSEERIDAILAEDVPYFDLTSHVLGIDAQRGEMEYFTREACVLAGMEAVERIARKLDCEIVSGTPSGSRLDRGDVFMTVRGSAAQLHRMWKVCLNVFDHCSAVATKTRNMVDAAHAANPACEVLTTRKSMPGAKDLLVDSVIAGGAFPHRLGLSETVLIFEQHLSFFGGFDRFIEELPAIRPRCVEKKLFVEADAQQALLLARVNADAARVSAESGGEIPWAGVDGVQVDKVSPDRLGELVKKIRALDPRMVIIAAGGINEGNVADYAATGVDGLATTAPYTAKPIDMSVRMRAL